MGKSSSPDLEANFEALLNWLGPDRERAAEMYEIIRQQLINLFAWSQCRDPDALADETFDRVMQRVHEISRDYVGDPRLYFFGVAKRVRHEARRREARSWSLDGMEIGFQTGSDENSEQLHECLDKCMLKLPPDRRELLLAYYQGSKQAKIDSRKKLAAGLGLRPTALRMVVYRTLNKLETCILECMKRPIGTAQ